MLRNLLCKISFEDTHFKIIPYGLNIITTPTTMRQIILKQNKFLSDMAIVPINGKLKEDEPQVMESLKNLRILPQWNLQENPLKEDGH